MRQEASGELHGDAINANAWLIHVPVLKDALDTAAIAHLFGDIECRGVQWASTIRPHLGLGQEVLVSDRDAESTLFTHHATPCRAIVEKAM